VSDALRESGRRVPDDIALVGYDNWHVFAMTSRPPLTTVDMRLEELGRLAARRLLASIDSNPSHGLELLPCHLVIRESSGMAPTPPPTPPPTHPPTPPPAVSSA